MIQKTPSGKYVVTSEDGSRRLSKPGSKAAAERRLRQVEFWKTKRAKSSAGRRA